MSRSGKQGFTLIELAIVLVIIGLLVGGVLVGQDMIKAGQLRATMTQVEKYNTAVNTFRVKFNALPGDIPAAMVTQFGFSVVPNRSGKAGDGDGNGLIESCVWGGCNLSTGWGQSAESFYFWEDLSSNSNLIEGGFNTAADHGIGYSATGSSIGLFLPAAKIGRGNYVYAYSLNATNYYGLSSNLLIYNNSNLSSSPGLTVAEAYKIDLKMDDGFPVTGNVQAQYIGPAIPGSGYYVFAPNAVTASPTTCFDTTTGAYSINQNNGSGINCALSFKFQ